MASPASVPFLPSSPVQAWSPLIYRLPPSFSFFRVKGNRSISLRSAESISPRRLRVDATVPSEAAQQGSNSNQPEAVTENSATHFSTPPQKLKVFVGNLAYVVDSASLAGLFLQVGDVELVEIVHDKTTGRNKGYGFVTMSSEKEVEDAIRLFNGYVFEGRSLRVNTGPPPRVKPVGSGNRVIVNNIPWDADDSAVMEFFSRHGEVVSANVVYDTETGRSRGFGFVTYSTEEKANNAIDTLHGVDFNGRAIRLSTAISKTRRWDESVQPEQACD